MGKSSEITRMNTPFKGSESLEEIEEYILKNNTTLCFSKETENIINSYFNVSTPESFGALLHRPILVAKTSLATSLLRDIIRMDTFRRQATYYTDTGELQCNPARHGRSIQDLFMLFRTRFPEFTLREFVSMYMEGNVNTAVCFQIQRRLWFYNESSEQMPYLQHAGVKDEFNKSFEDWANLVGWELNPRISPSEAENTYIINTLRKKNNGT